MTLKQFTNKIPWNSYDLPIETIISKGIIEGDINFIPLMTSYVKYLKTKEEEHKSEKIEMAFLMTIREMGVEIPNQKERELYMMDKYSNMKIDDILEKYPEYNRNKQETDFKNRFNL